MDKLLKWKNSVQILRNNKALTEIYKVSPQSLYTLEKNEYPNKQIQKDYNNLSKEYKYHSVMFYGIPFSILFADPSMIKQLNILSKID